MCYLVIAKLSLVTLLPRLRNWGRCPPLGGAYSGFLSKVGGAHPLYATAQAAARHNQKDIGWRREPHFIMRQHVAINRQIFMMDIFYHTKVGLNDLYD